MLNKYSKITAIICSTEYSAVGAIKACNQLNKKIGKDISIITFDGPVVGTLANPSLTAITHERKELGQKAIEILTDMDKGELGWVHASKIKEIVNLYQQPEQHNQKNLLFRGGLFIS